MLRDSKQILGEMKAHLTQGILPFWSKNGVDSVYGGYQTCFDSAGLPSADTDKYLVTQMRMLWGFSVFYAQAAAESAGEKAALLEAARQGAVFLIRCFWDEEHGGWIWRTARDGAALDRGKVVYGQSFAIYAMSAYTQATGDGLGLRYARRTFDLLQQYAADTLHGGYYENMEPDWTLSAGGACAGDRKSLDIHMHLMEAFTELAKCSGEEIHRRRLEEVTQLILSRMIAPQSGCGLNQFMLDFTPIPAIQILRTWNAERETGQVIEGPLDSTSYGHNVELGWLINRAGEVLGKPAGAFCEIQRRLVDHSLRYGFDHQRGGVYRDGPHAGPALVEDKEWWQNCEALVGYLDAYERLGGPQYLEAFLKTWDFNKTYLIHHEIGEWRQLLTNDGQVLQGEIGNPWKACYHTGRAILECIQRLAKLPF